MDAKHIDQVELLFFSVKYNNLATIANCTLVNQLIDNLIKKNPARAGLLYKIQKQFEAIHLLADKQSEIIVEMDKKTIAELYE